MADIYRFRQGSLPLLVSVPHDGREVPAYVAERMTPAARVLPDTDWHVARLYEFAAGIGASMIVADYSRYVIDLNRPASDEALYPGQLSTGLCPAATFEGMPIYADGRQVTAAEREDRIDRYWRPYHAQLRRELDRLRAEFGVACLWDAHSIASRVPSLFDGELPELNLGTNSGASCPARLRDRVAGVAADAGYSLAVDGRFRGGYITRHYGEPDTGIYAMQLELAQRTYMDERALRYDETRAASLAGTLQKMLRAFLDEARAN